MKTLPDSTNQHPHSGQSKNLTTPPHHAPAILAQCGITHPDSINTQSAAAYLTQLGIPTAKSTLEVFRCQSRGPKYKKIGSRVFYTKKWLDEYAQGVEVIIYDPSSN